MKKEELLKLGLDEDTAQKVADASATELAGYIPKKRFDEVNEAKKTLEGEKAKLENDLNSVKGNSDDTETLKAKIEALENDLKNKDSAHMDEIKKIKVEHALNDALASAKAKNHKAVKALLELDLESINLTDDGKIEGLDEKLKALAEDKETSFLFDAQKPVKPDIKGAKPGEAADGLPDATNEFEARLTEARKKGNNVEAIQIKREAASEGIYLT